MAKAPKNLAPNTNVPEAASTPEAASPKVLKSGSFTLTVRKTAELPPEAFLPTVSSRTLPFKEWFSSMEPGEETLLPASFWEERGVSSKPQVVRAKLTTAFKAWKEQEGHAEARQNHQLLLVTRVKGVGGWDEEDGVQLFMRLRPAS